MSESARELRLIPVDRIEVLNPRERNEEMFDEIVDNIAKIGLKKPITVSPRQGPDGNECFLLVCGEGRLKAFKRLPALIVATTDEDAFIMGLIENVARRRYRPMELVSGIAALQEQGLGFRQIATKTGLSEDYVRDIGLLVEKGEERLIGAVKTGALPMRVALSIVRAGDDDKAVQTTLQMAYEAGDLRGQQLIHANKLIQKRMTYGPAVKKKADSKLAREAALTPGSIIRVYQKEVQRQKFLVRRASWSQQRLLFVLGALRNLATDENFCNLLRAEGLDTVPKYLADRLIAGA
jgi:ParB family chromosome partitioning protein